MKRLILSIVAMMTITLSANAMSYEQARNEALFLTDKMAYELNLTDAQYEAAYEINLDYLMGVTSVDDVYGTYWTRRNLDLSYILWDWQWEAYLAANYFYRPLYWDAGFWHFGVYARYPRRTFFYFDRPAVYISYRGGHSWRMNGGRSYYIGRKDHFRAPGKHIGMRDRWDRGDFNNGRNTGRGSSTRITVNNGNRNGSANSPRNNTFGNSANSRGAFNNSGSSTSSRSKANGIFRNSSSGTFRNGSTSSSTRQSGTFRNGNTSSNTSQSGTFRTGSTSSARQNGTFRNSASRSAQRSSITTQRPSGGFSSSKSSVGTSRSSASFSGTRTSGSVGGSRSSGTFSGSRGGSAGGSKGGFAGGKR